MALGVYSGMSKPNQNIPSAPSALIGAWLIIGAALLFTFQAWIIKEVKEVFDFWQLGFTRWVFGLVLVVILAKASGFSGLWGNQKRLLLVRALVSTGAYLCIVYATQVIPISQATVLFFACPMFAAIHGIWLNREPVNLAGWLYIMGGFAGVVLVLEPGGESFSLHTGHYVALASAFLGGFSMAMMRKLAANNHPYSLYFYFCLIGVPVSMAPALQNATFIWPGWWMVGLILMSALLASVGQLMINQAFKSVPAHVGGVLLSSQVVFTAILGVVFLHEPITWPLALGACLILGCGAMLSRRKKPKYQACLAPNSPSA
jgi:drug/metabolite transporter (DMT)-like permease